MSVPSQRAVVIGASAGAVQALLAILPILPADYPLPILIAVHVPPDRGNGLVPLLQASCALAVLEAEDKERVLPGTVYFAPPDYHLLVERDGGLALSSDEPVNYSRPSIDVLFESAAGWRALRVHRARFRQPMAFHHAGLWREGAAIGVLERRSKADFGLHRLRRIRPLSTR